MSKARAWLTTRRAAAKASSASAWRLAVAAGAWCSYAAVFTMASGLAGPSASALALLPVATTGLLFGPSAGALAGLASLPLSLGLLALVGGGSWQGMLQPGGIIGSVLILIVGVLTGGLGRVMGRARRETAERSEAERALREENEGLGRFFDLSLDLLCIADDAGRFLRLNPAWERTLGYSLVELEGKPFLDLVHPEDRERTVAVMGVLAEGREVEGFSNRYRHRDGSYRWMEWRSAHYQSLAYAAARDITERERDTEALRRAQLELEMRVEERTAELVQANQALRTSEAHFRALVESSPEAIIHTDLASNILTANHQAALLYGGEGLEVLLGKKGTDFIAPEERARVVDVTTKLLLGGAVTDIELTLLRGDGARYPGELNVGAILDEQGRPMGVVSHLRDITQRKRAQEALRESDMRFRNAFDNSPIGQELIGLDGRILDANRAMCEMLGYSVDDIVGKHLEEVADAAQQAEDMEQMQHVIAGDIPYYRLEKRYLHQDGHTVWGLATRSAVRDAQGQTLYLVGQIEDLTERRKLESQFYQAQKMETVGRLAGGVAHDFNNLLTVIQGNATLARESSPPGSQVREDLDQVLEGAERAAGLTRQLLAFSRQQVMQPQAIDLNGLLRNVDKMLRRLIGEDVVLQLVPESALGSVCVDPGQIEQVITNLAVNARDAMPQGGTLTLETANVTLDPAYSQSHPESVLPGEYVMLAVSDTGTGMTDQVRAHLFEPFYTTKEVGKGTGLGLATVQGIVKQHGGHIWVYSEVGRGTTFKVYLPRVSEMPTLAQTEEEQAEAPRGDEIVLVVEDEEHVRRFTARVLRGLGYTVLEAADGVEALHVVKGHPGQIHLVVTDVVMPTMGGRELMAQLRQGAPELRGLFVSGYTPNSIAHHGVLDGGVAFLEKPFTPLELARKVRKTLRAT